MTLPTSTPSDQSDPLVGVVDGSLTANTRRFHVALNDDAVVQLDELLATSSALPDGRRVVHYGIVVEGLGEIEGAEFAGDTKRIAVRKEMPGETARRVEVQILRTIPEIWVAPEPGSEVRRAVGKEREDALFLDQMQQPLAVGLDQAGEPVYVAFEFLNGTKGGHVSISGISGVATKTSYALFLLYQLLETPSGLRLLGQHAANTRALVFNTKGEDLLHIDRDNSAYPARANEEDAKWAGLGIAKPGRFTSVRLYSPRSANCRPGQTVTDVKTRNQKDVAAYGWTPDDFIRQGLLRFCFTETDDRATQISFIEQRVRLQLARHAYPLLAEPGAVLLADPPANCSMNFNAVIGEGRTPKPPGDGIPVRNFADLVDFLAATLEQAQSDGPASPASVMWTGGVSAGTQAAFLRRLFAQTYRLGALVTLGVAPVTFDERVTVVDINRLHDSAQRFVVGALLERIWQEKQGSGREPLRFVVLDELNKFAPKDGQSPIKEVLVDIASRGRSLGVLLIGAQQAATEVEPTIVRNASIKVVGRLDAGETEGYRFLSPELRERACRFLPGTLVLDQPLVPAPIPIRFPFPGFATCADEGREAIGSEAAAEIMSKL